MSTIPLTTPYSLKNATLTIAADDYTAAVSQVQFVPSTSSSTWRGIGGNVLKDQSIAEWSCTIAFAQDLAPAGLLRYLLDNEGQKKTVVFTPVAAGPSITATLIMSPGDIGGTAGADNATSTVNLAADGKPVFSPTSATIPTIGGVSPSGAAAAALVTITGTGFVGVTGATGVKVGGVNATNYTVVSPTQIVATVPTGTAGSAPVIVTHPTNGASASFAYTRA